MPLNSFLLLSCFIVFASHQTGQFMLVYSTLTSPEIDFVTLSTDYERGLKEVKLFHTCHKGTEGKQWYSSIQSQPRRQMKVVVTLRPLYHEKKRSTHRSRGSVGPPSRSRCVWRWKNLLLRPGFELGSVHPVAQMLNRSRYLGPMKGRIKATCKGDRWF